METYEMHHAVADRDVRGFTDSRQNAQAPTPPAQPRQGRVGQALVAAFLLGLGSRLQVQVVGFLPLSELFIACATPFLLPSYTRRNVVKQSSTLMLLAFGWLAFTIGTDVYRGMDLSLSLRGVARVGSYLLCIPFCFVFFASDTLRRLFWFTVGAVPSVILSAYVFRSGVHIGRELTQGYSVINFETHWVSIVLLVSQAASLVLYSRARLLAYAISLAAGGFTVTNGSRAAGTVLALAVPMTIVRNLTVSRRGWVKTALAVAVSTLIFGWGAVQVYSISAEQGWLGDRARQKFEIQSASEFGLLLGGRIEFIGAVLAVWDSPLVGHGSWQLDTEKYYAQAIKRAGLKMNVQAYYQRGYPNIPSHSHVMGAWVENGLGGAIFWVYVLVLVGLAAVRPLADEATLRLWVNSAAVGLVWHILFSPISGRLETSICLAVFLTQWSAYASKLRSQPDRRTGQSVQGQDVLVER